MTLEQIAAGDVLQYWVPTGTTGGGSYETAGLLYARVVRVNRVTVTVETEHWGRMRMEPRQFERKCSPREWSPWNKDGN